MQSCVRLQAHAPTALSIALARKVPLSTEIVWGCEGVLLTWHNQWISEIEFFIRVKCSVFSAARFFFREFYAFDFRLVFLLLLTALATYFLQFLNICESFPCTACACVPFLCVDVAIHKRVKTNAYKLSKMLWIPPIENERERERSVQ